MKRILPCTRLRRINIFTNCRGKMAPLNSNESPVFWRQNFEVIQMKYKLVNTLFCSDRYILNEGMLSFSKLRNNKG